MEFILDELKTLMSIDSPSGFTRRAAEYTMEELSKLGYKPKMTKKGCVRSLYLKCYIFLSL